MLVSCSMVQKRGSYLNLITCICFVSPDMKYNFSQLIKYILLKGKDTKGHLFMFFLSIFY